MTTEPSLLHRPDFDFVVANVPTGARILDLGCGEGDLLLRLQQQKQAIGCGVELDIANVCKAIGRGLNIIHSDIDRGLSDFADRSFDVVVLSQTIQSMRNIEAITHEMLRIGKTIMVSLPNFAYWRYRLQLALAGHMPISKQIPYEWYNTPNIHFCSIQDFDQFCRQQQMTVLKKITWHQNQHIHWGENWRASMAIYHLCQTK